VRSRPSSTGYGGRDLTEIAAVAIAATPPPPVFELTLPPPALKRPASPPADPLAHIMALSDEERIALFS
jgi:hypothetical protein